MNLTLDIGNTAVKWATFEGRTMREHGYDLPTDKLTEAEAVLACASGALPDTVYDIPLITADTLLPIRLDYKTPATLGADRLTAAGASGWELQPNLTMIGLNEIMINNEK